MNPARAAAIGYGLVDAAVILAPSLVLAAAARKGGLASLHGLDLVVASAVVAAVHGFISFRRLDDEERRAVRLADAWIAALNALAVLAMALAGLLVLVLGGFADEHAVLVNEGWRVIWLWLGIQLVAITASELVGRFLFGWLEAEPPEPEVAVEHERSAAPATTARSPRHAGPRARRPAHAGAPGRHRGV